MRDLTIPELIKAIPLNKELREELLNNWTTYPEEEQLEIVKVCWDAFFEMQEILETVKREEFMRDVLEGKQHVSGDLQETIRAQVWEEIEKKIAGKHEEEKELDTIRNQLQTLFVKK